MKMIIGGAYQGKLAYAKKQNPYIHWTDGELCEGDNIFEAEGVFHFEKYIQSMIKKENWSEKEAIDFASKLTKKCPDIVIVTQEIGYGLVPVDAFDRRYRELTGKFRSGRPGSMRDRCDDQRRKYQVKIELENVKPAEIEKRSFEIITEELGDTHLIPGTEPIVKRCIHTSADFDYAKNLMFSEGAVEKALDAIRNGAVIVTDTQMAKAGINKRALVRLYELIQDGKLTPELIIGVPVGFVNVVQSKELILSLKDTPYIVARGRKGGSNIAACICNALLYML